MQGRLIRWNDEPGFGFISSKDSNDGVFSHISQFKKGYRRPKVGDFVLFQVALEKGKKTAKSISLIGVKPESKGMNSPTSRLIGGLVFFGIAFGVYVFLIKPILHPAYEEMGFSCEGKTHCSQMTSCDEAKYYLAHCPNVEIDGDNDTVPCERQYCGGF
jgi:cold shock CspA family protein